MKFWKRAACFVCVIIGGVGAVWAQYPPVTEVESNALAQVTSVLREGIYRATPWVQLLGSDQLGVGWQTTVPAYGYVRWTQEEQDSEELVWSEAGYAVHGVRTSYGKLQKALIVGYDPTKVIRIRAVTREVLSFDPRSLKLGERVESDEIKIPPLVGTGGKVTFAVISDLHSRTFLYPMVLPAAGAGVNFTVFNGDMMDTYKIQTADDIFNTLMMPMAWMTAQALPTLYLRGNHETRGPLALELHKEIFTFDGHYYGALSMGPTRIVVLDGGENRLDQAPRRGTIDFLPYL